MGLALCIITTLLGMQYIPASPQESVGFTKMLVAIIFIVLVWVLWAVGGGHVEIR